MFDNIDILILGLSWNFIKGNFVFQATQGTNL